MNRTLLACVALLAGCQPIDSGAALGDPYTESAEGKTEALSTPDIELEDGSVAADGCDATRIQAYQILDRTCANCHGGGAPGARQGTPPFDCVLDEDRMTSMFSTTAKDPDTLKPARFLAPGDPEHSRIYMRPLAGEMPPPDVIGLPKLPRPSASDLSILRHWIKRCVQTSDSVGGGDMGEHGVTH